MFEYKEKELKETCELSSGVKVHIEQMYDEAKIYIWLIFCKRK